MMARYLWLIGLCFTPFSFASDVPTHTKLQDLHLGEVFYYAYQGKYFDAISRLETEFGQGYGADTLNHDQLHFQAAADGFTVDDVELAYRMSQRAELVIKAIAESTFDQSARNKMAYSLARTYMQKNEPFKALNAIKKITDLIPEVIRYDEQFLRAQIYMANGQFEYAVKILEALQDVKSFEGFAAYDLGIALYQSGQEQKGLEQLNKTGQITSEDEGALAIRDKANLILGYRLLESGQPGSAQQYLDRVRLAGPYSNKALLGSGWVDAALGNFERALVPWTVLMKRNTTDKTVQESMLAVPYAYGKLGLYGKAAQLYGSALEGFDLELAKLDRSIKSIRAGKFFQAVAREEFKQDKNWVVKLRDLPGTPETYYLLDLMASSNFQEALNNYLDLDDLRKRLAAWDVDIAAYKELIDSRRKFYKPILPGIDKRVQALDAPNKSRQMQRQILDDLVKDMLATRRSDLLATTEERNIKRPLQKNLRAFEKNHKGDNSEEAKQIRLRSKRLMGVLQWQMDSVYDQRLADFLEQLHQLDRDEENLAQLYDSFFVIRKVASQGYEGYEEQINQLMTRVHESQDEVKTLLARQGHILEEMASNELGLRRKNLEEYQVQAIFALAEIYDRAVMKQNSGAGMK